MVGARGRALAARYHPELERCRIKHWTSAAVRRSVPSFASPYDRFLEEGAWLGSRVRDWLGAQARVSGTFFSYDTTALEPFSWARNQGLRRILGQIDPARTEADMVTIEREKWPGWEASFFPVPEAYHERRNAEWALADTIIVNSRWSRDALVQQGVPAEKLEVVPLVYETVAPRRETAEQRRSTGRGPLRVLFLGQVNLRKGIPYLLEAARMVGTLAEFSIVGPIQLSDKALASAPPNARFTGAVSRSDVPDHYARADVFVLPTISDGFAITQIEAMAHGLPVITTPNCGEVVTDGVNGLMVPARDPVALAAAVELLATDRTRLQDMRNAARKRSREFTIDSLAERLSRFD